MEHPNEESIPAQLAVTFGNGWYRLVGASVVIGTLTAVGVYFTGRMVFKDTFANVKVNPVD
jgi:hypothetical protein